MQAFFLSIQRWLIGHRTHIFHLFQVAEVGLIGLFLVAVYFYVTEPKTMAFQVYELGRRMGYIGLFFYLSTLVPGILSRLRWVPLLGVLITPFRRHLGIIMFLCAFIHQGLTTLVPSLVNGRAILFNNPKIFGFGALLVLFPLWLTSNDASQKYLGKKWKLLHRLTYLALLLIFLHVAYFRKRWWIPTAMVLGLEIYSWLVFWWRNRQKTSQLGATDRQNLSHST